MHPKHFLPKPIINIQFVKDFPQPVVAIVEKRKAMLFEYS